MKIYARLVFVLLSCTTSLPARSQNVLFDFNNGPQFTSTPLDQTSGGIRAHFTATGSGYSIQNTAQVIGVLPTGFSGLGLCPNSVFGSDLMVAFYNASDSSVMEMNSVSMMVAPQELACDSSSTIRMYAYHGQTLVGFADATANLDVYTWPTINSTFSSSQPFDNIVIHFQAGPPTGGDWGPIFAADNLDVTPVPEPAGLLVTVVGLGVVSFRRRN